MTSRRDFLRLLGLGTAGIFVPQFGRWHRQGSGLLVPTPVSDWREWYIALLTSDGTELSGGGYTRQRATVVRLPTAVLHFGDQVNVEARAEWRAAHFPQPVAAVALLGCGDHSEVFKADVPWTITNGGDLTVTFPVIVGSI